MDRLLNFADQRTNESSTSCEFDKKNLSYNLWLKIQSGSTTQFQRISIRIKRRRKKNNLFVFFIHKSKRVSIIFIYFINCLFILVKCSFPKFLSSLKGVWYISSIAPHIIFGRIRSTSFPPWEMNWSILCLVIEFNSSVAFFICFGAWYAAWFTVSLPA